MVKSIVVVHSRIHTKFPGGGGGMPPDAPRCHCTLMCLGPTMRAAEPPHLNPAYDAAYIYMYMYPQLVSASAALVCQKTDTQL